MGGAVVLGIIFVVCAFLAYVSKRRFGVLGLALAAGALMESVWSPELLGLVEGWGVNFASISVAGMVSATLVLLPAVLLLFSGPGYSGKRGRFMGSILFAGFATALLVPVVSQALILDSFGRMLYVMIEDVQRYIITGGIVLAILDLWHVHGIGGKVAGSKGKH